MWGTVGSGMTPGSPPDGHSLEIPINSEKYALLCLLSFSSGLFSKTEFDNNEVVVT